ncbi:MULTISPECIES: nucleotidyltransferase family protein [Moorena]|uniref:Nucleotidyltransferase family protein n=1 Tax=Moorena producens 3L TaxID=489825 RepID=F4XY66_9CYAN|nr:MULTISPECIES: nucleotidyltransferase family protein [Moorena]EGJ30463.1 hypothetical protein LYNGBM3L_50240 [Moorena producens 3L]NEP31292.1 nucleotidyltransferase family protein [Moorena sp. SIO3B2]NEP65879.1 nucleotidyltransferase family protein [Moorena sp. SIO3A5]NEQ09378.1 nucleotidyltransferase family protein [Moorena sp. SIO4E2]NER87367.1 nucleotidyltransferase family protein [Moorena sp. SIO3A2]
MLKSGLGIAPQLVRPEAKLLLCCARTKLDPDLVDQIQLLVQQDLDWLWIVGMAQQQKVLPLLVRNLSYLECTQIPSDLWQYMQAKVRSITLYNLSLTRTLVKLLPQLEARGIAAIPYKGPTLAAAAYGDLALREFVDLDLLVSEQDFESIKEVLRTLGYHLGSFSFSWSQNYVHEGTLVNLDVHRNLTQPYFPFRLDFKALWQDKQPIQLMDQTVEHLAWEDLLVVLCVQVAKDAHHHQKELSKVCDIAEVIRAYPNLDWEKVLARATAWGGKRLLLFGLCLTHDLLATPLPPFIWQKIKSDLVVRVYAKLVGRHILSEEDVYSSRGKLGMLLRGLMLLESPLLLSHSNQQLLSHIILARFRQKFGYSVLVMLNKHFDKGSRNPP